MWSLFQSGYSFQSCAWSAAPLQRWRFHRRPGREAIAGDVQAQLPFRVGFDLPRRRCADTTCLRETEHMRTAYAQRAVVTVLGRAWFTIGQHTPWGFSPPIMHRKPPK